MAKKLTLEECNEKYWDAHPNLNGLVDIIEKSWVKYKSGNGSTWVKIRERSTGRTYEMAWSSTISLKQAGIPDTFDCHPYSLKNMTKTYWDAHPNLNGLVEIIEKWCVKSPSKKGLSTYVKLKECSTGRIYDICWSSAISSRQEGIPDTFDCHPYSLKNMNEIYWNVHPELRGLVEVIEKWCEKSTARKSTYIKLKELSTGRTHEANWSSVVSNETEGIPDTFDCHPYSLKNMTKTYWDAHPNLRGLVIIANKYRKNNSTYIKIKEISTCKTYNIRWDHAINPNNEGVPDTFSCYEGTKKNPSNEKLCIIYFCKLTTYGKCGKWSNGPYLTVGKTLQGSAKQRYSCNGHIKTFHEFETYNCNIHEKSLLEQITALLGKPEAGNEAWQWSQNREDIIKKLFLDHFLKDYVGTLDTKHTIMP